MELGTVWRCTLSELKKVWYVGLSFSVSTENKEDRTFMGVCLAFFSQEA